METKTINDFYNDMLTAKASQPALNELNSTSKVSVYRLMLYIAAVGAWILQNLIVQHLEEVKNAIGNTKPGTVRWYRTKAFEFQFGHNLVANDIVYDNTGLNEADIEASKVVKNCATSGKLRGVRVKVAGENSQGVLEPLSLAQETALKAYLEQIKSPGVRIYLINNPADWLKLNLKILFDPLVLNSDGKRLDGSNDRPVQTAIDNFFKNMPFDGVFTEIQLLNALQAVDGVVVPHLVNAEASYASLNYMQIDISYMPDSGYLILKELTLIFEPYNGL